MSAPPKWLQKLLRLCCPEDRMDVLGDFEEWYQELREEKGKMGANLLWLLHSLSMLKLKIIARSKPKTNYTMARFYLKIAKRNLLKNKLYTSINMVGLAVGTAVCVLIGLYIQFELSYDKHFANHDRVYRVAGSYDQGGGAITNSTLVPYLLQSTMQNNLDPDVLYTRMDFVELYITVDERTFWEDLAVAVDSNFFEVFETKFLSGDPKSALDHPGAVVIDKSTAYKYFNERDVVGKSLEIDGSIFEVTGVIEDLPSNTHFEGKMFIPISSVVDQYPHWMTNTYGGVSHRQYLKVPEGYNESLLEKSLNELVARYVEDEIPIYFFQSLPDIHLTSDLVAEIRVNGSYRTIYIFLGIAFMILLIACINFINLSVAGALQRIKEVGIKKVFGASRGSQIRQFQIETLIISGFASLIAVLLAEWCLPLFNSITGIELTLGLEQDLQLFGLCLLILAFVSIIAGSVTPLFLLKIPTMKALSATVLTNQGSKFSLRNILVGVQFFLAAIIISSTLVVLDQLSFMRNKDLGIDIEQLVIIPFQSTDAIQNYSLIKEELEQQSYVQSVSASTSGLSNRVGGWRQYRKPTTTENINIPTVVVAHDFFETIDASFALGRGYDQTFNSDYMEAYVVNEEAAKFLELKDPIGSELIGSAYTGARWTTKNAQIIGVVKDFHFASMHNKIRPVVFSLSSENTYPLQMLYIKLRTQNMGQTMEAIEELWAEINPDTPFRYRFVDEAFAEQYEQEAKFLNVFSSFATLSIIIGCLGLFGLTAFVMRKRTKEIGIRKVLGANQISLLRILSKDFMQLVLVASILGIPITFWLMMQWLENFEYRVTVEWWVFGLTILGVVVASGISITFHSVRVASTNPVESLKHE